MAHGYTGGLQGKLGRKMFCWRLLRLRGTEEGQMVWTCGETESEGNTGKHHRTG